MIVNRTFLFDIDGTLVMTGGAGKYAMMEALESVFAVSKVVGGVSYAGRTDRAIVSDLLEVNGIEPTNENVLKVFEAYYGLIDKHLASCPGDVLPGIREILDTLAANERDTLGLLTGNTVVGARAKLSHYNIYDYFGFGGYGDHHASRNLVAEEAWRAARSYAEEELPLEHVWVIGDTQHDVACAKAIGAKSIAVATGFEDEASLKATQPDLLFKDFSDVAAFLQAVEP